MNCSMGKKSSRQLMADVTSYKVEKLLEDTAYAFSVVAIDEAGNKSIVNPTAKVTTKGSG